MLSQVSKQLNYYYNQAKSKQKTKQEVLTIMNRKKAVLGVQEPIKSEHLAEITQKFDEMITLVNRLPD